METLAVLALVGALLKQLRRKGVLTDEESRAVYDAAIKAVSDFDVPKLQADTLSKDGLLEILRVMAAKPAPPTD